MGCIDCTPGLFPPGNWNAVGTPVTLPNGTTITASGPSTLVVSKGGASQIFTAPGSGQARFFNWGTPANFLAILTIEGSLGSSGRTVVLVNTESPGLSTSLLLTVLAPNGVASPILFPCPGPGGAFLLLGMDGTNVFPSMWTSDTGAPLCSAGSFAATLEVKGNATATMLEIKHGGTTIASCPKPVADCHVAPLTGGKVVFPEAVTGAGVPPALSTTTKQVTISNTGTNCLQINSISDTANFARIPGSESNPFPVTLQAGQNLQFDVRFTPPVVAMDTTFDQTMAINPTPVATDTAVNCRGKARPPHITISYSISSFGAVPVGTSLSRNLVINNTGEIPVTVSIPAPPPGIAYTWIPPSGPGATIAPGNNISMAVTFAPLVEGTDNRTLTFTSNASGSPHSVSLTGSGCVARPVIQLPNMGPIAIGNVQQGFHTVRSFKVRNTGNGGLIFSARILPAVPGDATSEADALLFGLLQNNTVSVTSPPALFNNQPVAPVTICGPGSTGAGEFLYGVSFFASGTPRAVSARMEVFNHNDTTSGAPASFMINLTAAVTNPISVDVELVLDRSGSMGESSGSRTKIETARDAAKLFVALSRPDVSDRIGLVRFNSTPEIVPVNGNSIQEITSANHLAIGNTISPANFTPDLGTCIAGGVMVAEKDIITHPRTVTPAALNKILLVLTDGHDNTPYVNPDDGVTYSLLGGNLPSTVFPFIPVATTPLPVPADMKIYAIGIGDDIDVGRLGTLATSTGGTFLHAHEFSGADYFSLEKHFTQVYMEAVNYAVISDPVFTILPGETHQFEFEVLNGDKSAMVVIYDKDFLRIPFMVLTPTGELIDLLNVPAGYQIRPGISPTARFIEINMPQGEPERYAGTWKVLVKHDKKACYIRSGSQTFTLSSAQQAKECKENYDQPILYGIAIGVGSNFNMIPFVTPGIVHVGEPIQLTAMVSEFGLPVTGCTVTVVATKPDGTQSTHILADDGVHGDDLADDGTYGLAYIHTSLEGTYTFVFTCTGYSRDGKPVKRESVRSKFVEGHVPLIPDRPVGGNDTPGAGDDKCCRQNLLWMRILVFIGILAVVLLGVILLRI